MRRREFFGFASGAASAWAVNAFAQQMYRVAVLTPSHTQWQPRTFRDAMQELGYREDVNLNLTVVSGENQLDRMPKLAADLVASAPDVIVAVNTPGTRAAIAATSKIPIVSAIVADPVFLGFVANIARPEANVTGVANMAADITSKRIALLKEVIPSARRFALLTHPECRLLPCKCETLRGPRPRSALSIEPFRCGPRRTCSVTCNSPSNGMRRLSFVLPVRALRLAQKRAGWRQKEVCRRCSCKSAMSRQVA